MGYWRSGCSILPGLLKEKVSFKLLVRVGSIAVPCSYHEVPFLTFEPGQSSYLTLTDLLKHCDNLHLIEIII